jgi:hypothetical protein
MNRFVLATVFVATLGFSFGRAASDGTTSNSGIRIDLDEQPSNQGVKPGPKPSAGNAAPTSAKKAAPDKTPAGKKADAKKDNKPGKIDGIEIARATGGFLGLAVVDGNFRLKFYNAEKKPTHPDVSSVVLRWPVNYQRTDERATLTATGEDNVFSSEKVVRPPFTFRLNMTLFKDGADEQTAENYVIEFHQ